jgi:hypothetical protein
MEGASEAVEVVGNIVGDVAAKGATAVGDATEEAEAEADGV